MWSEWRPKPTFGIYNQSRRLPTGRENWEKDTSPLKRSLTSTRFSEQIPTISDGERWGRCGVCECDVGRDSAEARAATICSTSQIRYHFQTAPSHCVSIPYKEPILRGCRLLWFPCPLSQSLSTCFSPTTGRDRYWENIFYNIKLEKSQVNSSLFPPFWRVTYTNSRYCRGLIQQLHFQRETRLAFRVAKF